MNSSKESENPNAQHKRFVETAREIGCEEDKEKFEAALAKIAAHKPLKQDRKPKGTKRAQKR